MLRAVFGGCKMHKNEIVHAHLIAQLLRRVVSSMTSVWLLFTVNGAVSLAVALSLF